MTYQRLEDILKEYGVVADYWEHDSSAKRPKFEEIERQVELLWTAELPRFKAKWEAEAKLSEPDPDVLEVLQWMLERWEKAKANRGYWRFFPFADGWAKKGKVDAALKAYEAAILDEDDPNALWQLGYLLLQRCRVEKLPFCSSDLVKQTFTLAEGSGLQMSLSLIDADDSGPEFPDKVALLRLAIRAFGLAWLWDEHLYNSDEGYSQDNALQGLIALDGLRASFFALDDLRAIESVLYQYQYALYLDLPDDDLESADWYWADARDAVEPFIAEFHETTGYLRGRKAASSPELKETLSRWEKLLPQLRELADATHRRLDLIVEKLIDLEQSTELTWGQIREWAKQSSEAEKTKAEEVLKAALAPLWEKLATETQEDLIDAEVVFAHCKRMSRAWRCCAISYCAGLERELKRTVEHLTGKVPAVEIGADETLGGLIEILKKGPVAWAGKSLPKASRLFRSIGRLENLNEIRIRVAHPLKQQVVQSDVVKLRELLLSPRDGTEPLLALIVQARDGG